MSPLEQLAFDVVEQAASKFAKAVGRRSDDYWDAAAVAVCKALPRVRPGEPEQKVKKFLWLAAWRQMRRAWAQDVAALRPASTAKAVYERRDAEEVPEPDAVPAEDLRAAPGIDELASDRGTWADAVMERLDHAERTRIAVEAVARGVPHAEEVVAGLFEGELVPGSEGLVKGLRKDRGLRKLWKEMA